MGVVLVGRVLADEVDTAVAATYLDTRLLAMLGALFIPLLVNLLTKKTASDGLKAVVNIIGVGLVTVLSLWINPSDQPPTLWLAVNTFLASLIASFVAYKGVWKPTGVSGTLSVKTASFGLGSPPVMETPDKGAEDMGQVDQDPRG